MPSVIISATDAHGAPAPLLDHLFSRPSAVAADPATGDIAVADAGGRVWVVSIDLERAFPLHGATLPANPSGVAFDGERGTLLVTDRQTHRLLAFDRDSGAFEREIGRGRGITAGHMLEPLAVVVHEGVAVVAEGGPTDRLQAFGIDTGLSLWTYPPEENSSTAFTTPTALAVDAPRRLLWVADANGVRAFDIDGVDGPQLRHELADVHCPRGLAVCRRGLLHVTDARGYTVYERVVGDDGITLHIPIHTDQQLCGARGIAEADDGGILVCHGQRVAVVPPVQLAERRDDE